MTTDAQAEPQQPKAITVTPVFTTRDMARDDRLCFVLMPFGASFDRVYRDTIRPAVKSCGLECRRADDIFSPTPILEDIWAHIYKSRVIIADVTGRNPNVFYEVGIAHTVGRPVVAITQSSGDIPFDIAQFRYFTYSDDAIGWANLRNSITSALGAILTPG